MNSRIALGTVQFGMPYGVANRYGQVTPEHAAAILAFALAHGVDTLDTAIAYGDSERQLGEIGVGRWQVITKLPAIPDSPPSDIDVGAAVRGMVIGSLERLRIPALRAVLLHHPEELRGPRGGAVYRALLALKTEGKIEKVGVSIYSPDELDAILPRFAVDIVQAPLNVVDRRLVSSGWLARLHRAGIKVHIRSIFLQGLLLMEADRRPPQYGRWQPLWDQWHRWLTDERLTPLQSCLAYALSHPEVDRVVVGVDSLRHLQEILAGVAAPPVAAPPATLSSDDRDLINPSRWAAL